MENSKDDHALVSVDSACHTNSSPRSSSADLTESSLHHRNIELARPVNGGHEGGAYDNLGGRASEGGEGVGAYERLGGGVNDGDAEGGAYDRLGGGASDEGGAGGGAYDRLGGGVSDTGGRTNSDYKDTSSVCSQNSDERNERSILIERVDNHKTTTCVSCTSYIYVLYFYFIYFTYL